MGRQERILCHLKERERERAGNRETHVTLIPCDGTPDIRTDDAPAFNIFPDVKFIKTYDFLFSFLTQQKATATRTTMMMRMASVNGRSGEKRCIDKTAKFILQS